MSRLRPVYRPRRGLPEVDDRYPEHTKMSAHTETNWAIRDFLEHLFASGVVRQVSFEQIEQALLTFHGIDADAYRLESRKLIEQYGSHVAESLLREVSVDTISPESPGPLSPAEDKTPTARDLLLSRLDRSPGVQEEA